MANCVVCKNLQPERFELGPGGYGREITIPRRTLRRSAAAGCEGCSIIHEARRVTAPGPAFHTSNIVVRKLAAAGSSLVIWGQNRRDERNDADRAEVYILEEREANKLDRSWPGIEFGRHVADSPFSPTTRNLPNEWLQDCILNHPKCQLARESILPTRIIYIGTDATVPRLHISNGAKGRYATLSHCWGKSPLLTTTTSTMEQRLRAINIAQLPTTFQHAVLITRRLGIEYLWIDSLCIIQDSKDDWARESFQMQDVYSQAIVNISADDASDSTVGLCSRERLASGFKVGSSKVGGDVYARPWYGMTTLHTTHVPDLRFAEEILSARGWVVQERQLSPRILHFSKYESAWVCDTHTLCECTVSPRKSLGREFRKALLNPPSDSYIVRKAWSQLVFLYTGTELTYGSDKLIAIAGLASQAANSWKRTYIAGLWVEDLPNSLFWGVYQHRSHRLQAKFPSWSWASIQGRIRTWPEIGPETKSNFDFRLKSIWYGTVEKHFDRTLEGEINRATGSGLTKVVETINSQVKEELRTQFLELGVIWGQGRLAKINFVSEQKGIQISSEVSGVELEPDVSDWSEFVAISGSNLYLLAICAVAHERYSVFYCLVLRDVDSFSCVEGRSTFYQRIGTYRYKAQRDSKIEFLTPFYEQDIYLI